MPAPLTGCRSEVNFTQVNSSLPCPNPGHRTVANAESVLGEDDWSVLDLTQIIDNSMPQ
jgi:hypothetical protein